VFSRFQTAALHSRFIRLYSSGLLAGATTIRTGFFSGHLSALGRRPGVLHVTQETMVGPAQVLYVLVRVLSEGVGRAMDGLNDFISFTIQLCVARLLLFLLAIEVLLDVGVQLLVEV